jgi:uncharacterized membrane protein
MSKTVICLANTEAQAEAIVQRLNEVGIPTSDVSVLFPDKSGSRDFAHEHNTKAPEGTAIGASAGGVTGGVLGLLAGIGALAIPGVGPFIAAGPIMAALSGAAVGAAIGGIGGALIGLGIPEFEARQYEAKIKEGNILISAHAADGDVVDRVKKIMKEAGAEDITSTGEVSVSDNDRKTEDGRLAARGDAKAIDPTVEAAYWRDNFKGRPYAENATSFDDYAQAYDYGVNSYAKYPGRNFDDVEDHLSRDWDGARGASKLQWVQARNATRDAWERIRNR